MKVFVDGENFRHQVAHILVERGVLPKEQRNDFFHFDLAGFLAEVLETDKGLDITYYTTHIKQPDFKIPVMLSTKLQAISEAHRRWIAHLTTQNIRVVKAGHLKVRESSACVHCGKKTLILQEKGVDVRVATDILLEAGTTEPVAVVSSDSDIGPALEAAKRKGGEVWYVCPANRVNRALVAQTSQAVTFDPKKVLAYHRKRDE